MQFLILSRTLSDDKEHLEELIQLTEEIAESARESQLDLRKECDDYIVRLSEVSFLGYILVFTVFLNFRNAMKLASWRIKSVNMTTSFRSSDKRPSI